MAAGDEELIRRSPGVWGDNHVLSIFTKVSLLKVFHTLLGQIYGRLREACIMNMSRCLLSIALQH